jgi:hypothetical protein
VTKNIVILETGFCRNVGRQSDHTASLHHQLWETSIVYDITSQKTLLFTLHVESRKSFRLDEMAFLILGKVVGTPVSGVRYTIFCKIVKGFICQTDVVTRWSDLKV